MGMFEVGDIVEGHCNNAFGDCWSRKVCILVSERYDYAVFRHLNGEYYGEAIALNNISDNYTESMINTWMIE